MGLWRSYQGPWDFCMVMCPLCGYGDIYVVMGTPAWPLGSHQKTVVSLSIPGHQDTITWTWGPHWVLGVLLRSCAPPCGHGDACVVMEMTVCPWGHLQCCGDPSHGHGVPVHPWPPGPYDMAIGTSLVLGDTIPWPCGWPH